MTWARAASLGCCHLAIGEHKQAIELFSTAVQPGNSDPRYQWAAMLAFSHYLLGQYDASLSWTREALYFNPNHLQVLACGRRRWRSSVEARKPPGPRRFCCRPIRDSPSKSTCVIPLERAHRGRPLS